MIVPHGFLVPEPRNSQSEAKLEPIENPKLCIDNAQAARNLPSRSLRSLESMERRLFLAPSEDVLGSHQAVPRVAVLGPGLDKALHPQHPSACKPTC